MCPKTVLFFTNVFEALLSVCISVQNTQIRVLRTGLQRVNAVFGSAEASIND